MRDDELRRVLTDANPWWRVTGSADPVSWVGHHRLLRERGANDLGYRPNVLSDLREGPIGDALVILSGARRVGKSVALLDLAAALCARPDVDVRQVIHLPCDGMHHRDLRRALTIGRDLTKSVDREGASPRVWLFDEITGVAGWSAVIKAARDGTPLGDDTVVATGSRWADKDETTRNLLAGRAGTGDARRVRHLFPMTFRDYVRATQPGLHCPASTHPASLQDDRIREELDDLRFAVDDYDLAWQGYLTCGGFPRAVAEHTRSGAVSDAYLRDIGAWLQGDVDPEAPPDSVPHLLAELAARSSSPLNATNTARTLGYPSRQTFDVRIRRLVASFAAVTCPRHGESGRVVPGSQTKVYLSDPILAWLPSRLRAGLAEPDFTQLTEAMIGIGLARVIDALDEGRWMAADTIGYVRTASGKEIDLAPVPVPSDAGSLSTIPIESKWIDQGWRSEAKVIEGKYSRGIVATKSVLDLEHPSWAVPAPVVALLLG
jgi:uncharacterized protein